MLIVHNFDFHDSNFMFMFSIITTKSSQFWSSWSQFNGWLVVLIVMLSTFYVESSWFWLSSSQFDGFSWWSWCSCCQLLVSIIHCLTSLILIWWSWLWSRLSSIWYSISWWSPCSYSQFFTLIIHNFDPRDLNLVILIDGFGLCWFDLIFVYYFMHPFISLTLASSPISKHARYALSKLFMTRNQAIQENLKIYFVFCYFPPQWASSWSWFDNLGWWFSCSCSQLSMPTIHCFDPLLINLMVFIVGLWC
jgi:hypothetical protein